MGFLWRPIHKQIAKPSAIIEHISMFLMLMQHVSYRVHGTCTLVSVRWTRKIPVDQVSRTVSAFRFPAENYVQGVDVAMHAYLTLRRRGELAVISMLP